MKSGPNSHIKELDALRGIAAVIVSCFFHIHYLLGGDRTGPLDGTPVFTWIYEYGWTMVDLFFVISGFVFSHVYLRDGAFRKDVSTRSFTIARFARLYPLHILATLLVIPALLLGADIEGNLDNFDLYHFILNLLMLQESGLNNGLSYTVVSWSLSVEVYCYAIFLIAALMGRRALFGVAVVAILGGIVLAIATGSSGTHIARGFVGFFAGYFAWRLRNLDISWQVLLIVVVAPLFWHPEGITYGIVLGLTSFPALVLLSLRVPVLRASVFQWFGDRSYSIYLLHPVIYFFGSALLFDARRAPPDIAPFVWIGSVVLLFCVADLSFRYFETPMRRWLRQKLDPIDVRNAPVSSPRRVASGAT